MGKKIIAGLVLGIAAISLLFALVLRPYERAPQSSYAGGGKVGVIYIEGAIAGGSSSIFAAQAGADAVAATIREAAGRPELKAVVVRLNSPGGTPAAAQEIDAELQRLRQAGKVVVASMGDVAASGAYWIAAGADRIVANPGTMTGSIGVLMQTTNLEELYGKIGIDSETFKSGPYKDMGSTDRPVTPEERAIFQAMIDDIYDQFVEVVARGRHMDVDRVKALADGRVYTGRQALELGLVDQLGDFHDAVSLAGSLAGIAGEPDIVVLGERNPWQGLLAGIQSELLSGLGGLELLQGDVNGLNLR
ncbi:MAG: signal peptide peptidase SppA [Pelotomaculum sp.]